MLRIPTKIENFAVSIKRRLSPIVPVFVVAGCVVLAVSGYALYRTGATPLIMPFLQGETLLLTPTTIELGVMAPGTILEEKVRVLNLSGKKVQIIGSQESCRCLDIGDVPVAIAADSEYHLTLMIQVFKTGDFDQQIRLFSDNEGAVATPFIRVRGTVK
jgi:hypothetical protein